MAKAQIVVENGVVVFSPSLLQEFPEITATITGNVITVSNAWREDLISVTGDNVFWAEKQDFASFSIIFTDNKAKVDNLSNLIVRYVNFHNGDYKVSSPKYVTVPELITDPLNMGIRPNYYGLLSQYADGEILIEEVAKALAEIYRSVTADAVNEALIVQVLGGVSIADINLFLSSQLSAMDTYNAVKDNPSIELDGTGSKTYSLSIASKELEIVEENGDIVVTKLCVKDGEDVSEIVDKVIENAPSITQCVLQSITSQQFADAPFVKITTDFGVHATIQRGGSKIVRIRYDSTEVVANNTFFDTMSPLLWGEFIADIVEKADVFQIGYIMVYGRVTSYGTIGTPKARSHGTYGFDIEYFSASGVVAEVFSVAKDILLEKGILLPMTSVSVGNVVPANITEEAVHGTSYSHPEQFFNSPKLLTLYWGGTSVPMFNNGVLNVSWASAFSIVGTPLHERVTEVRIRNQAQESSLMAQAVRLGFKNVKGDYQDFGVVNDTGFGFEVKNLEDEIINLIEAGVKNFNQLSNKSELFVSRAGIGVSTKEVTHGSLLICPFGEATGTLGYFESGVETPYLISDIIDNRNMYVMNLNRYKFAMREILLNGVSISDKEGVLKVILGEQPISVHSVYSLRKQDIELFMSIFASMREGYRKVFRFGSSDDAITDDEDAFAYSIVARFYDALIGGIGIIQVTVGSVMTAHHNLVKIAKGQSVSVGSTFSEMEQYKIKKGVLSTGMTFSISLGGVSKSPCTISSFSPSPHLGYITYVSDGSDDIDFAYGNIDNALENASPDNPSNYVIHVLMHHTFIDNVLVLYYAMVGYSDSQRFTQVYHIVIDTKTTKAQVSDYMDAPDTPQVPTTWGTIEVIEQSYSGVSRDGNYVHYTFTDNGDGSVTVNYTAYDKDGNDITDQFNTLSIGDYFLHKEVE